MRNKKARLRVRSRGVRVLNAYSRMVAYYAYAQLSNKWREWNFRTISQRQAESLVAAGEAVRVTRMDDGVVRIVGYRATQPTSWERPSPATLTYATMQAVANDCDGDGSRLSGRQRQEVLKFRVWPLIGDTKAVAVRPKLTDAERRIAENLLFSGGRRGGGLSGMLGAA